MIGRILTLSGCRVNKWRRVVALIIFEVKIVMEERLLLSTFGEQYVQFKERVPQLIPFTKRKRS